MKQRILYLAKFYGVTVVIFIIAKLLFLCFNSDKEPLGVSDVWDVILHGISLDLSTALYLLSIPFLLTLASLWIHIPKIVYRIYNIIIAIILPLAFIADTCLYPFWQFKLDASCLTYLESPAEVLANVSGIYVLAILIIWILTTFITHFIYKKVALPPQKGTWQETILYIVCIPLFVIGIRGGLDESTTNIGQVYFSQRQFLNQAAINPVFSFFASLEKTQSDVPEYHFLASSECQDIVDRFYTTKSIQSDTLLRTKRPNVVIILLESCGGIFTRLEGDPNIMPRLNQLMDEGISFDSCYANSWRTDRGTVCTYSGYPSFPTTSVMKMPAKTHRMPGIAKSLAQAGYKTSYVYGGDINFTNMRSYLISTGFEQLTWKKDYDLQEQATAEWGVRDDITFRTVRQMIEKPAQEPFLIGYSTLSSHEPWDVPINHFQDETLNAFYYVDQCIGEMVDSLKQTPAWDNLLLILLPDHGVNYNDVGPHDRRRNHIPMLWIGGAIKEARHITTICNQTDLAATLLGQMGIAHDDFPYSRDIMSKNYISHFAIHTFNNGISMIDSTGHAVYDLNVNQMVVNESSDAKRLIHNGKAILQNASENLKNIN